MRGPFVLAEATARQLAPGIVLSGGTLDADDIALYPQYLALAEGSLSEAEFAAWLRQHIRTDAKKQVNEPRARYARGS